MVFPQLNPRSKLNRLLKTHVLPAMKGDSDVVGKVPIGLSTLDKSRLRKLAIQTLSSEPTNTNTKSTDSIISTATATDGIELPMWLRRSTRTRQVANVDEPSRHLTVERPAKWAFVKTQMDQMPAILENWRQKRKADRENKKKSTPF